MNSQLMIYGANGYTGTALVERALARGLRPVLAGRNQSALVRMAARHDLPFRCADLHDTSALRAAIRGVALLINAAGPFAATAQPMVDACLAAGAHYVDVSGELQVHEALSARHAEARARGIALLPGAGLLVTAGDCLGRHLAAMLPDIQSLKLGIARPKLLRSGSLKTIATLLDDHVEVIAAGVLRREPVGARGCLFDFGAGEVWCTAVSGAELVACQHSTGAPNIEVYMPASAAERTLHRTAAGLAPWLNASAGQALLRGMLDRWVTPSTAEGSAQVLVGLAESRAGRRECARLTTPEPYRATTILTIALVERVLDSQPTGFLTPASLYAVEDMLANPGFNCEPLDATKL